jgi:hypothetical protein
MAIFQGIGAGDELLPDWITSHSFQVEISGHGVGESNADISATCGVKNRLIRFFPVADGSQFTDHICGGKSREFREGGIGIENQTLGRIMFEGRDDDGVGTSFPKRLNKQR